MTNVVLTAPHKSYPPGCIFVLVSSPNLSVLAVKALPPYQPTLEFIPANLTKPTRLKSNPSPHKLASQLSQHTLPHGRGAVRDANIRSTDLPAFSLHKLSYTRTHVEGSKVKVSCKCGAVYELVSPIEIENWSNEHRIIEQVVSRCSKCRPFISN